MAASKCFSGAACSQLLSQDKGTTNSRHRGAEVRDPLGPADIMVAVGGHLGPAPAPCRGPCGGQVHTSLVSMGQQPLPHRWAALLQEAE